MPPEALMIPAIVVLMLPKVIRNNCSRESHTAAANRMVDGKSIAPA